MSVAEKFLAVHAGLDEVKPGQLVECDLDIVLANDITAPITIDVFRELGATEVFDRGRICLVPDHYAPNKDIKSAEQPKKMRDFAHEQHVTHYYEQGCAGIEHALLPERGVVVPGDLIIGADSHTCTYGALGAFSTGVGSTDAGVGIATGRAWFKVPPTIRFEINGELTDGATAKDIILHIIGMIGVDGARDQSIEFSGEGVKNLTIYDRLTSCNMAIEAGGKNGIFPVDDVTRAYVEGRVDRPWTAFEADPDAEYERVIDIDLGKVDCTVAWPHLPENAHSAREGSDIAIDQIVIGSCTNGRIEDFRAAAAVVKGRKVAPGVRALAVPGSIQVRRMAEEEGLDKIFIEAGFEWRWPGCSMCLAMNDDKAAPGSRVASTSNRNFVGRMGDTTSEVYLTSPAVAAASAVLGHIGLPEDLD